MKYKDIVRQQEKLTEVIMEHNKSLNMMLENMSALNDALTEMRGRVGDLEAKVAYYVNDKPVITVS